MNGSSTVCQEIASKHCETSLCAIYTADFWFCFPFGGQRGLGGERSSLFTKQTLVDNSQRMK